jgi:AhpD family alkylhydroperoxidase
LKQKNARIDWQPFQEAAPEVVTALTALGKAVDDSGIEKPLTELVKLRVSQLNGCAFCVQYHLNSIRKCGVMPAKLDLIAQWREVQLFSARERAALAWAEALTVQSVGSVDDAVYVELQERFSEREVVFLTACVGLINAWNRIAGGLQFSPPIPAGQLVEGASA